MQIGLHPAPGFGELMPGSFVVPHNPVVPASYVPRIGELLPGKFSLPENPVVRELAGYSSLRPSGPRGVSVADLSSGCGCIAGMCGQGCEGMGDLGILGLETIGPFLPWIAGGVLLFMLMRPGGKGYRADVERARGEYAAKVAAAKSRHRGYKRLIRPAARRARSGLRALTA